MRVWGDKKWTHSVVMETAEENSISKIWFLKVLLLFWLMCGIRGLKRRVAFVQYMEVTAPSNMV